MPDDDRTLALYFSLFNEVGIVNQLATALFQTKMPKGMMVAHFSVLNHLIRVKDGQTPLVLARAFQVPKTTMTHTLGGLEKQGFIEMRPNPRDKRSKRVWITDAGRAFRDSAIQSLAPDVARLSESFEHEDVARLVPALQRLRVILDEDRDREDLT